MLDHQKGVDIVYNSLSDKFLFLKKGIWQSLQDGMPDEQSCMDNLKAGGFLVQDSVDELQVYKRRTLAEEYGSTRSHLIINPTINCNFNCWYCYESHLPSKMSGETMKRVFKLIKKLCAKSENLTLSFFGGEPFLYYDDVMLPIIKFGYEEAKRAGVKFSCNCTTNGSLLTHERIEQLLQYGFNFAQITLDGDEPTHDANRHFVGGKGSYKIIVSTIKELIENGIKVTLRINYTKENIDSVGKIPESFSDLTEDAKRCLDVSFHKVWQDVGACSEDIGVAVDAFTNVGILASEQLFGERCYGDLRSSAVVNYNGDVYKCTAVDFENSRRDGYLSQDGDIVWENDALEKRMASKFTNKPCLSCAIFPICHGGCTSRTLENEKDFCILGFDEKQKEDVVMNKLLYNIRYVWK